MASSPEMMLLVLTLGLVSFVSPAISCSPELAIVPWCDKTTTYPELCKYFFTHEPKYTNPPIKGISDFVDASLQLTLDRAVNATRKVKDLSPLFRSDEEKKLWSFCVHMFELSVYKINQSIDPITRHPKDIAVSWLFSSLNDQFYCQLSGLPIYSLRFIRDKILEKLIYNSIDLIQYSSQDHAFKKDFQLVC